MMAVSSQSTDPVSSTSLDKYPGKIKLVYLRADEYEDTSPPASGRKRYKRHHPRQGATGEDPLVEDMRKISMENGGEKVTWAQRTSFSPSNRNKTNTAERFKKSRSVNDLRPGSRVNSMDQMPLNPLGKWSHRSTSNRLLNCFTIDDCVARHREKLAVGTQPVSAKPTARKSKSLEHFNGDHDNSTPTGRDYLYEETDSIGNNRSPSENSTKRRIESRMKDSSNLSLYMAERMSCPDQQDTLERAMYTLLSTTEVVNNTTHAGLFRRAKVRPETVQRESHRFRRLNETLRRWIDEEYIRPRTCPGGLSKYRSTPTIKAKIQIRPKSSADKRSSEEIAENHKDSESTDGRRGMVKFQNGDSSNDRPKRSDSLLQMLMGMENDGKISSEAWRSLSADSAAENE